MSEKKVLHIISTLGFFGAEKVLVELAKQLSYSECRPYVGILCNNVNQCFDMKREAEKYKLECEIFLYRGKIDIGTILKINGYLKKNNITVVHSHGYKSNVYCFFASWNLRVKRIVTCHNWLGNNLKMKLYETLDKLLLNSSDKVVVVSERLRDEVIKSGVSPEKVIVINNGIDLEAFLPLERDQKFKTVLSIKDSEMVIGTVGRLIPEKGHTYLLRAFKNVVSLFPETRLILAGDGPLKESLLSESDSLGLGERVQFLGVRKDIPQLISVLDIFVMSSINEGMPVALLEAMASKKPVIATNVGAIQKIIVNEQTGLLVEPGDIDGLSNAIIRLLRDRQMAQNLAVGGFEKVRSEFSSKKMTEEYIKLYNEVLTEN